MQCHLHADQGADSICMACGKGLCATCRGESAFKNGACSVECNANLETQRKALEMIVTKTLRAGSVTGWFCLLSGGIFALAGALMLVGGAYIGLWLFALGLLFLGAGYYYRQVGRRDA